MKTVEDMAREYQRSDQSDGTTASAFENGASWMRTELTAWNDPKIQLPTHDKEVLCITDRTRNTYAVLRYKDRFWYQWSLMTEDWRIYNRIILGWREIHID